MAKSNEAARRKASVTKDGKILDAIAALASAQAPSVKMVIKAAKKAGVKLTDKQIAAKLARVSKYRRHLVQIEPVSPKNASRVTEASGHKVTRETELEADKLQAVIERQASDWNIKNEATLAALRGQFNEQGKAAFYWLDPKSDALPTIDGDQVAKLLGANLD